MGFFDFLKGKNSQSDWKKTLVRDLVMLTTIDGDMDKDEIKSVLDIAVNDLEFTEQEFIRLIKNLRDVKDIYPTSSETKFEYMLYLIRITYSDGYVDDNEIAYMELIADKMGLPEGGVQKAMKIIENELLDTSKSNSNNEDTYTNDSSIGKILITSPFEPTVDVQTVDGVNNYLEKVSKYSLVELSIELSNVLSAKYNNTSLPSGISTFSQTQKIVTDLTDKALLISFIAFSQEKVLNYCNNDTRIFNQLINDIDSKVVALNLAPAPHGKRVLDEIHKVISR